MFTKRQVLFGTIAVLAMAVSFTAFAAGAADKSAGGVVNLTMLIPEAADDKWNLAHDSPVQKEMTRVTGTTLEIQYVAEEKYNVIVASGDLPDIVRMDFGKGHLKTMVDGKHIIALDDLLKTHGPDIMKTVPQAVALRRAYSSFGSGKLYSLPAQIGPDSMGFEVDIGPTIRWDYYLEAGAPPLKTDDDLLAVLAKIVQKHPETDDGKKIYGVGFWSDWADWVYAVPFQSIDGFYGLGSVALKNDGSAERDIYTDMRAPLWRGVTYYYKANKLGILDPDSFIMKVNDFLAKCTSGQEVTSLANWATGDYNKENADKGKGFMVIPLEAGGQWKGAFYPVGWGGKDYGISTTSKHPEKAMDLLNYFFSYDGARTMYSGVKGMHWTLVDGKAQPTPEIMDLWAKGKNYVQDKAHGLSDDMNLLGLSPFTINPADKTPLDLSVSPYFFSKQPMSALQTSFSDHYKVNYPAEVFARYVAQGKNVNQSGQDMLATGVAELPTDDIVRIRNVIVDTWMRGAAKVILSTFDSEFEANKQALIAELKAAGSDTYYAWSMKTWKDAKAVADKIRAQK